MEKSLLVNDVSYESDIIRLTIGYDSYETATISEILSVLAENGINIDLIVQTINHHVKPTMSFTIAKEQFAKSLRILESSKQLLGFCFADFEVGLAKVSIFGTGVAFNSGVAAKMFARLGREGIHVKMISTSEVKVSVVVNQEDMVRAANVLHDEFQIPQQLIG